MNVSVAERLNSKTSEATHIECIIIKQILWSLHVVKCCFVTFVVCFKATITSYNPPPLKPSKLYAL